MLFSRTTLSKLNYALKKKSNRVCRIEILLNYKYYGKEILSFIKYVYVWDKQLVKIGTGDITDIKDKTSQILLLSYTSLP